MLGRVANQFCGARLSVRRIAASIPFESIVNTDRYSDLLSADLVQHCRSELAKHQTCRLPEFLRPEAIASMLSFATHELKSIPSPGISWANVYYQAPWTHPDFMDPEVHKNHVVNRLTSRSNSYITADKIPQDIELRTLQDNQTFQAFLEKVTNQSLYEYNCKVSKFVFSASHEGDHQDWHFDNNFLTLTFMLQEPEDGGMLEVYPRIGRESYDCVASILDGKGEDASLNLPELVRFRYRVGDMILFIGRDSLHRATAVQGKTTRVIGIISYNTFQENSMPNAMHYEKVYGLSL